MLLDLIDHFNRVNGIESEFFAEQGIIVFNVIRFNIYEVEPRYDYRFEFFFKGHDMQWV